MTSTELISMSLLSPPVLFFLLGLFAGFIRSDLTVPESISRYFALYLMMAIGFKGGVALSESDALGIDALLLAIAGIGVGFMQPVIGFWLLKATTELDRANAAAVSAHYGSVSMVTFAAAVSYLEINNIIYAGYIVAILALMEAPAIGSGLILAGRLEQKESSASTSGDLVREVMTNGAVLLLLGSFIIGSVTGQNGMNKIGAFLSKPFQGFLCFFLLDMGLLVARNKQNLLKLGWPLVAFGIYMPIIGALIGTAICWVTGSDFGTSFLFVTLCASASYIAVPAAMRLALPQARAEIYLPLSLGITFPFNILIGLPVYYKFLQNVI